MQERLWVAFFMPKAFMIREKSIAEKYQKNWALHRGVWSRARENEARPAIRRGIIFDMVASEEGKSEDVAERQMQWRFKPLRESTSLPKLLIPSALSQ